MRASRGRPGVILLNNVAEKKENVIGNYNTPIEVVILGSRLPAQCGGHASAQAACLAALERRPRILL